MAADDIDADVNSFDENNENDKKDAVMGSLAVAIYDFEGEREDMLSFKEGDVITIIEMNSNGWWKGTSVQGRVGIFPYSYVEVKITSQESFPFARAVYDLPPNPDDPELLSFDANEVITIIKQVDENWSFGKRANGDTGRFPVKYVEVTGEYNEELFGLEMEKWERLELQMKKEQDRILAEKAELERKYLEDQRDKREQEMKDELDKAKEEAEDLKKAKLEQEEELKHAKQELERMKEEIKRREARAQRELEKAKAEAAALRKMQEAKDARKSMAIRNRLGMERDYLQRRLHEVGTSFNGYAPGPPPTPENLEIDENPFGESVKVPRKKLVPLMKPVYKNAEGEVMVEPPKMEVGEIPETAEQIENSPPPMPELPAQTEEPVKKSKVLKKFAKLGKGASCKGCGEPVGIANRVKACKGIYHDTCFRCATCNKIIRNGEYVDRNDNPYCELCHKKGFGPKGFGFGLALTTDVDAVPTENEEPKEEAVNEPVAAE